ncbi:Serine proteases trypsin domain [Trinorchestia longiramus]|nr:Serine proteases trypsin domain [Trinorchestia longiramus]
MAYYKQAPPSEGDGSDEGSVTQAPGGADFTPYGYVSRPGSTPARGYMHVEDGDNFVRELHDPTSPPFRAKAAKYQAMLDAVYMRSLLAPAFAHAAIVGFGPILDPASGRVQPGLGIDFRITLDRRKIPGHIVQVEQAVQATLVQELISLSPVAFRGTDVAIDTLVVHIRAATLSELPLCQSCHSVRAATLSELPLSQSCHSVRAATQSELPLFNPLRAEEASSDPVLGSLVDGGLPHLDPPNSLQPRPLPATPQPPQPPQPVKPSVSPQLSLSVQENSDEVYKFIEAPGGAIIRVKARPSQAPPLEESFRSPILVQSRTDATTTTTEAPPSTVRNLKVQKGPWRPVMRPFSNQEDISSTDFSSSHQQAPQNEGSISDSVHKMLNKIQSKDQPHYVRVTTNPRVLVKPPGIMMSPENLFIQNTYARQPSPQIDNSDNERKSPVPVDLPVQISDQLSPGFEDLEVDGDIPLTGGGRIVAVKGENGDYYYFYDDSGDLTAPGVADNYYEYAFPALEEDKIENLRVVPETFSMPVGGVVVQPSPAFTRTVEIPEESPTTEKSLIGMPPFPLSEYPARRFISKSPLTRRPIRGSPTTIKTKPILETFVIRKPSQKPHQEETPDNHREKMNFGIYAREGTVNIDEDYFKESTMSAFDRAHIRTTKSTTQEMSSSTSTSTTTSTTAPTTTTTTTTTTSSTTTPTTTTTTTTTSTTPSTTPSTTTTTTLKPTIEVSLTTRKTPSREEIESLLLDLLALSSTPDEMSKTLMQTMNQIKSLVSENDKEQHSTPDPDLTNEQTPGKMLPKSKVDLTGAPLFSDGSTTTAMPAASDLPHSLSENPSRQIDTANFETQRQYQENLKRLLEEQRKYQIQQIENQYKLELLKHEQEQLLQEQELMRQQQQKHHKISEENAARNENEEKLEEEEKKPSRRRYPALAIIEESVKINNKSLGLQAAQAPEDDLSYIITHEMPSLYENPHDRLKQDTSSSLAPQDRLITFQDIPANEHKLVTFHDLKFNASTPLKSHGSISPLDDTQSLRNNEVQNIETVFINNLEAKPHRIYYNNHQVKRPLDVLTAKPPTSSPAPLITTTTTPPGDDSRLSVNDSLNILSEIGIRTPEQLLKALRKELMTLRNDHSDSHQQTYDSSIEESNIILPQSESLIPEPKLPSELQESEYYNYDYRQYQQQQQPKFGQNQVEALDDLRSKAVSSPEPFYKDSYDYENPFYSEINIKVKSDKNFDSETDDEYVNFGDLFLDGLSSNSETHPELNPDEQLFRSNPDIPQYSEFDEVHEGSHLRRPDFRISAAQENSAFPVNKTKAFRNDGSESFESRIGLFEQQLSQTKNYIQPQDFMGLLNREPSLWPATRPTRLPDVKPSTPSGLLLSSRPLTLQPSLRPTLFPGLRPSTHQPVMRLPTSYSSKRPSVNINMTREQLIAQHLQRYRTQQLLLQQTQEQIRRNQMLINQASTLLRNPQNAKEDLFLPGSLFPQMNPISLGPDAPLEEPAVAPPLMGLRPPAALPPTTPKLTMRDFLTTRKPLVLDTEVVTSVSLDVEYKHRGTTKKEQLSPVYVAPTDQPTAVTNRTEPYYDFLTVPVITGDHVDFVKVSKTKMSYPKVVIVNTNPTVASVASTTPMAPIFSPNVNEGRGGGNLPSFSLSTEHLDKLVRTLISKEKHASPEENKSESTVGTDNTTAAPVGANNKTINPYEGEIVISDNLETINAESVLNSLEKNLPEELLGSASVIAPNLQDKQTGETGGQERPILEAVRDLSERYMSQPEVVEKLKDFHEARSQELSDDSRFSTMDHLQKSSADEVDYYGARPGTIQLSLSDLRNLDLSHVSTDDLRRLLDRIKSDSESSVSEHYESDIFYPENYYEREAVYPVNAYDDGDVYKEYSNEYDSAGELLNLTAGDQNNTYTGGLDVYMVDDQAPLNEFTKKNLNQTIHVEKSGNKSISTDILAMPASEFLGSRASMNISTDDELNWENSTEIFENVMSEKSLVGEVVTPLSKNSSLKEAQAMETGKEGVLSTTTTTSPNSRKSLGEIQLTDITLKNPGAFRSATVTKLPSANSSNPVTGANTGNSMNFETFREDLAYLESIREQLLKSIQVNKVPKEDHATGSSSGNETESKQFRLTLDKEKLKNYMSESEILEVVKPRSRRDARSFRPQWFPELNPFRYTKKAYDNEPSKLNAYDALHFTDSESTKEDFNKKYMDSTDAEFEGYNPDVLHASGPHPKDVYHSGDDEPITVYVTTEDFKYSNGKAYAAGNSKFSSRGHGLPMTTESPVHTFVLRQGQSLHDLLQEIFKKLIEEEKNVKERQGFLEGDQFEEKVDRPTFPGKEEKYDKLDNIHASSIVKNSAYDGSKGYISVHHSSLESMREGNRPTKIAENFIKENKVTQLATTAHNGDNDITPETQSGTKTSKFEANKMTLNEDLKETTPEKEIILLKDVIPLEKLGIVTADKTGGNVNKNDKEKESSFITTKTETFAEKEETAQKSQVIKLGVTRIPVSLSGLRYTTKKPNSTAAFGPTESPSFGATNSAIVPTKQSNVFHSEMKAPSDKSHSIPIDKEKINPVITQEEFLRLYSGLFLTSTTTSSPLNITSNPALYELFPVMTRPMNRVNTTDPLSPPTTPHTVTDWDPQVGGDSESPAGPSNVNASLPNLTGDSDASSGPLGNLTTTTITTTSTMRPVRVITSVDVSVRRHGDITATECEATERACESGECIPATKFCNLVVDCEDESDEIGCTCADFLRSQFLERKICDEIIDCWDMSDEAECEWCSPGQFICSGSRQCVDQRQVCDGAVDCQLGDDEVNCVTIAPDLDAATGLQYYDEGYVMVRRKGRWGKLCVDNLDQVLQGPVGREMRLSPSEGAAPPSVWQLGESVCRTLSYSSVSNVERIQDPQQSLLSRIATQSFSPTTYFEIHATNLSDSDENRSTEAAEDSNGSDVYRARRSAVSAKTVTEELKPKRTLALILSEAGFGFREMVVEQPDPKGRMNKRSTSALSFAEGNADSLNPRQEMHQGDKIEGNARYSGRGRINSESRGINPRVYSDEIRRADFRVAGPVDPVTVDGRTAAVGEPFYPSTNEHKFSSGQKLKHTPLRYGGTFYGRETTTKSPFRYTPKPMRDSSTSTATNKPDLLKKDPTAQASLYNIRDSADHYAYLYDVDPDTKPVTTVYEFYQKSHKETKPEKKYTLHEDVVTTSLPNRPFRPASEQDMPGTEGPNGPPVSGTDKPGHFSSLDSPSYVMHSPTDIPYGDPDLLVGTARPTPRPLSKPNQNKKFSAVQTTTSSLSDDDEEVGNSLVSTASSPVLFSHTTCPKKDVLKLSCGDLQCGVRPQATGSRAKFGSVEILRRTARIVGGSNSAPGAWPWQAALYKQGEYQCGASLISGTWLISAGHCFYGSTEDYWVARLGALRRGTTLPSPYEQTRTITHVFIHPDYIDASYTNDIALLKLANPVSYTDYVRPVCLPPSQYSVTTGRRCTLIGWGQLFEVGKIFRE